MRSPVSWFLALVAAPGCQGISSGTYFDVEATLEDASCGSVVEAPDSWSFQVRLKRTDDELSWYDVDTRTSLSGSIDADEELTLTNSLTIAVTDGTDTAVGCTVRRRDRYEGAITGAGNTISAIDGELTFTYSEESGYDCAALIGASGGFDELPCELDYSFVATPSG